MIAKPNQHFDPETLRRLLDDDLCNEEAQEIESHLSECEHCRNAMESIAGQREWWNETVETPCVAIGGINPDNAATVIQAGADFIAVSSGVWNHPNGPASAVKLLSQLCSEVS